MRPLLILALLALAACGADGEPEQPGPREEATEPGISISGNARFGVVRTW